MGKRSAPDHRAPPCGLPHLSREAQGLLDFELLQAKQRLFVRRAEDGSIAQNFHSENGEQADCQQEKERAQHATPLPKSSYNEYR